MSQLILTSSLKKGGSTNARPCKQALTTNHRKASHAPAGPQPFQSLGDTTVSVRSSANTRDKQWIPFSETQSTYTKKGLSAGTCSVQMTAYHISSLPSGGRQRDRATISKMKTLGDLNWTGWLSKSNVALKKYTKLCTLFIITNISWVRHCAEGCWRKKKKITREKKKVYPTQIKLPAHWYLFSLHEVIWAGWIPVESTLYSQCLPLAWDVCHS